MIFRASLAIIILVMLSAIVGCSEKPVPSEIQTAMRQKETLWGAGASVYAPQEYQRYLDELAAGKALFDHEQSRLFWWKNYSQVTQTFQTILLHGEELAKNITRAREKERAEASGRHQTLQDRIILLRGLSGTLKDRRLSAKRLMQAEILLNEAHRLIVNDKGREAMQRLTEASADIEAVSGAMKSLLQRFADRDTIESWCRLVDKAIQKSRRSGGDLLVITKVERRLKHYRKGVVIKEYEAGMGFNFLTPKLHAGDKATPEGSYHVTRKVPHSRYYRALLINYPNGEDRVRFKDALKKGLIPERAGIGGLIEIHGGGRQGMTNGCVALDNRDMALLYEQISLNTPVVIVGTTDYDNLVASFLNNLQ